MSDEQNTEQEILGISENDIDYTSDYDHLPDEYFRDITEDEVELPESDDEADEPIQLELTYTYEQGYVPFPSGYGVVDTPQIERHSRAKKKKVYYALQAKDKQKIIEAHIRDPNRSIKSIRYDLMKNHAKVTNKRKWTPACNFNYVLKKWNNEAVIRDKRRKESTSGPNEPTVMTPTFMKKLEELVDQYPTASQMVYSVLMGASVGTINTAIRKLKYKAYRLRKCTMLNEKQIKTRLKYCNSMRNKDVEFFKRIWWTDECYIMENKRMVNSKNTRFYARDITLVPRKFYEQAAQSQSGARVMIWAGFR